MVLEGILKCGQVEGGCWRNVSYYNLHDGTGVWSVTRQDVSSTIGRQVWGAGVIIVARHPGREGRRGVIVQDQGLTAELREVDDHVGAFSGRQQQGVQVHVTDIKAGRVGDPGRRLLAVYEHRR